MVMYNFVKKGFYVYEFYNLKGNVIVIFYRWNKINDLLLQFELK